MDWRDATEIGNTGATGVLAFLLYRYSDVIKKLVSDVIKIAIDVSTALAGLRATIENLGSTNSKLESAVEENNKRLEEMEKRDIKLFGAIKDLKKQQAKLSSRVTGEHEVIESEEFDV